MTDKTRTIKIRVDAYRQLKIAAARRGLTMLDLLDQLVAGMEEGRKATARDDRAEGR
jgi:hypothetical protein